MTDKAAHHADLAATLRDAGQAHHRAFAHVNGEDAEWPAWYAAWLTPRIRTTLARPPETGQLALDLRMVEDERQARAPGARWPDYYAEWLLLRYGPGSGIGGMARCGMPVIPLTPLIPFIPPPPHAGSPAPRAIHPA